MNTDVNPENVSPEDPEDPVHMTKEAQPMDAPDVTAELPIARDPEDAAAPDSPDADAEGDLCQDFGHASSRNQAAIGMASGLGSVLSKKAAMASAGTL